jgi:hypothetical protein
MFCFPDMTLKDMLTVMTFPSMHSSSTYSNIKYVTCMVSICNGKNHLKDGNGERSMIVVIEASIGNRSLATNWCFQMCSTTPPSDQNYC